MIRSRKIGSKVHYIGFQGAKPENGMIKSLHPTDCNIIYVVYHCNGDWKRFKEFIGQRTCAEDLHEGWI